MTHSGGGEDKPSSEVVNASEYSLKDDSETAEAHSFIAVSDSTKKGSKKRVNQKRDLDQGLEDTRNYFSGPLLPSEVTCLVCNYHDFALEVNLFMDLYAL